MKTFFEQLIFSLKIFIEITSVRIDIFLEQVPYGDVYLYVFVIFLYIFMFSLFMKSVSLDRYQFKKYFSRVGQYKILTIKNAFNSKVNYSLLKDVSGFTKDLCYSYYKELPLQAKFLMRFSQIIRFFKKQHFQKPYVYDYLNVDFELYAGNTKDTVLSEGIASVSYMFLTYVLIFFVPIFYLNLQFLSPFFFSFSWSSLFNNFSTVLYFDSSLDFGNVFSTFRANVAHKLFKFCFFENFITPFFFCPAYISCTCDLF